MPRKSVLTSLVPLPDRPVSRLAPPAHLSKTASAVWRAVVATEAPDHFARAGMAQLLERYCELTATARGFEAELAAAHDLDTRLRLSKHIADLGARASALALRLRLTPASRERTGRDDTKASPYDQLD